MTKWTVVRVWRDVEADTALDAIMRTRPGPLPVGGVPYDEVRAAEHIRLLTGDDDPVAITASDENLLRMMRRPTDG